MYLSKLELHGFKSFADRTTVDFSEGVTVVVGPNGCGKSNIVDAVRWVIGEQRARVLRSEKMENVIFNGAGTRRPLGMAEVMLTVENTRGVLPTEYSEVTLGRRLYRSGDSEYLLNGVQCRLKDITDLFMDTGMGAGAYSVIELKMIEELLSENALDRRRLFEEAAGITKYKIRRAQTLRKLSGTQVDLTRVRDLTDELDKRVRSLERQAQKASRFKRLNERLTILELSLAQVEYDRMSEEVRGLNDRMSGLKDQLDGESAKLAKSEAEHEAFRTRHVEREQTVVAGQTRLSAHLETLRAAESDERLSKERLHVAVRETERLAQAQETSTSRELALNESQQTLDNAVALAQPASESAQEQLGEAQTARDAALLRTEVQRKALDEARRLEREASAQTSACRRSLDRTTSRLEMVAEDLVTVDKRIGAIADRVVLSERQAEEAQSARDSEVRRRDEAQKAVQAATEARDRHTSELTTAQEALRTAQRRMDAAASEVDLLGSLLASFEDFSESVQFLAANREWSNTDELRTVADLIGCDDGIRPAVEAALGDYAACLVVESREEAARAVRHLRDHDKGRATFMLLDRIPQAGSPEPMPEGVRSLLDLVRVDAPFENLAAVLLRGAGLATDLRTALAAADESGRLRLFTPEGEWAGSDGMMHAGSDAAAGGAGSARLGRREQLARAQETLNDAQAKAQQFERTVNGIRAELDAIGLGALEKEQRDASRTASASEQAHTRASLELEQLRRQSKELSDRKEHLTRAADGSRDEINELAETVALAEKALKAAEATRFDAENAFQAVETESRRAVSVFSEAKITAVQATNQLDILRRDIARTVENIGQLRKERADRSERLGSLEQQRVDVTQRLAELAGTLETLRDEKAEIERIVSASKDSLGETKTQIADNEVTLRQIRRTRELAIQEENRAAVRRAELETRTEDLLASIAEDFEIDLASARVEMPAEFEPIPAREEVQTLRTRIRNLGPVNALALETFEEERERLSFLQTQLRDLESAEGTLLETITEINQTASQRFDETFGAISENFSRLFRELFGEDASASVALDDPNDPLESAIEIFAKPTGKKPSVLAQLSGGEKTLTAIALLFAIYLVKPSPFCILDEVDAPLDDANVDRFMHLIRSFARSTQFILVTHNKRTMEAADRMYGITMQEQGVSRLVGVRFDEEKEKEPNLELVA